MRDAALAEFDSPEALIGAIDAVRNSGYRALDAFLPFPNPEVERALGLKRSSLPKICFALGLLGAATAYGLQWLLEAYLYPLNVGGRPPHFPLPFLIITFEMGILATGFAAFFGVLGLARLPRLWHPVHEIEGFSSATNDRFWLVIHGKRAPDERDTMERKLEELHARRVVWVEGGHPR